MKNNLKNTVLILFSVFAVVACTKQSSDSISIAPETLKKIKFLSGAELNDIEGVLSRTGTKKYDYRVVRVEKQKKGGRTLKVESKSKLRGLLLMRNKQQFTPLGGAFYDDGQGNLMHYRGSKKEFSMNYMAKGKKVLSLDVNHDRLADTVIGNIDADTFWIMSEHLARILPCLSSSVGDIFEAGLNCSRPENTGGSEEGAAGGGATGNLNIGADLLGEPICGPTLPGGIARGDTPEPPPGEDPAPPPVPPSTESPDDPRYPPMGRHESTGTNTDGGPHRVVTNRTSSSLVEQHTSTNADGTVERTTIHRDAQGRETYREDVLVGPGPDRQLLMHRVNHTTYDADGNPHSNVTVSRQARAGRSLPPIGPGGTTVFEDPRCAGRDRRAEQGLGFLDLCAQQGSSDFLSCFRQMESPLFNVTGGRCRLEPGPAGGNVLNCSSGESIIGCIAAGGSPAECARNRSRDDDNVGPGGPDAGPTDGPRIAGSQQIDLKYIDTIPFGAVLIGICSRGGCPDPRPF